VRQVRIVKTSESEPFEEASKCLRRGGFK
jgi:hypothetical protein